MTQRAEIVANLTRGVLVRILRVLSNQGFENFCQSARPLQNLQSVSLDSATSRGIDEVALDKELQSMQGFHYFATLSKFDEQCATSCSWGA